MVKKDNLLTRLMVMIVLTGLMIPMVFSVTTISAKASAVTKQVDWLVIANPNLVNVLIPLINYRTAQGLQIATVSPDFIEKNAKGKDKSDKIRSFLISKYEAWNLKYVLLVGSFDEIPYKPLYPSAYQRDESKTDVGKTMSDFYYSDLSSDFDYNKNGYSGEYSFDDKDLDFTSEVLVGRIPFDNVYDVRKMVTQILDFEKNPKSKSALLTASILSYKNEEINPDSFTQKKTDGASLTEAIYRDLMASYGYKAQRMYEISGVSPSVYLSEYPLKKTNFEKLLRTNPYDIVLWNGHGSSTLLETKIWQNDTNVNKKAEKREIIRQTVLDSSSFNVPVKSKGIFLTGSCSSIYPIDNNFGMMALKAGFSAFIGGTNINWYSEGWTGVPNGGNQSILYLTIRNMILRNDTIGESLYQAINDCYKDYKNPSSKDYQNFYSFDLYGDPAMRLIPINNPTLSMDVDQDSKTINLGDNLDFTFLIQSSQKGNIDLSPLAINYDKSLFTVYFYADVLANNGKIKMKILMAKNTYPTVYSMTVHFKTYTRNVFKVIKFLILPWESNAHLYLSYPDNQVKKNSEFTIDLCIRKVINADTVYVEIAYNDSILYTNPRNVFGGNFLNKDGVLPNYQINAISPGLIGIYATRMKRPKGISGEGILFSINFKAIKDGFSNVSIVSNRYFVYNPVNDPINTNKYDSKVTVSNSGIFINRNLAYGYATTKTIINNSGSTNGDKLWIGNSDEEKVVDKSDSERFTSNITLDRWDNKVLWVAQKDEDNFVKIRIPVFSNSFISMDLKIGQTLAIVNGKEARLETPPILIKGRTMVPIRFISETYGANVIWNDYDQSIRIVLKGTTLNLWIGKTNATIEKNGVKKTSKLDTPPLIKNGRTLVPIRFIMEAYSSRIEWIQQYLLVQIHYLR
jgi:hypothetical protein